jgi:hypothetical protein
MRGTRVLFFGVIRLRGLLDQQRSIAALLIMWSAHLVLSSDVEVLKLTAALKLLTSTVRFGPLGAGRRVLAIAIRTLLENIRDTHVNMPSQVLLSRFKIWESLVDFIFDPNMRGNNPFLEHQDGLYQGCDSR